MANNKRITPERVAKALGMPVQTLRVAIQHEVFPFAKAFKKPGYTTYQYIFSPGGAREYLGDKLYDEMMGY